MTTSPGVAPQPATARPAPVRSCPARLAEGVELLGEYEDSGYREAPFIARRSDGKVIQLTRLLHLIGEEADGERSNGEIARRVSARFGRRVSAGNVQFLVERKLRPLGVLAAADGTTPKLKRRDPLLALRVRTALVPERIVGVLTRFLWPLFLPPVLALALGGIVALDVWLFFFHGVAPGLRAVLYQPAILVGLFGVVVLATGFHELGHASACRYGGARPGAMGAGIYVVWPVFYCDVTDAYRLGRAGRLRVDLGGIYFNGLFALVCAGAFLLTGYEPLLVVVVLQHLAVIQQLLPLLRLDGYYVISDLTGVPDILTRIRPILRSLIPGRRTDDSVEALKPWVRVVVSAYVVTLAPVLVAILTVMIISAPRVFATAWDSLGIQFDRTRGGLADGRALAAVAGTLQTAALLLPAAGTAASLMRIGRRIAAALGRWASGRPPRVAAMATALALLLALAGYTWWPNGDYRPIGPQDRGTVAGAVRSVEGIPSGKPAVAPSESREAAPPPASEGEGAPAAAGEGPVEAPSSKRGGTKRAESDPSGAPEPGRRRTAPGPEARGASERDPARADEPATEDPAREGRVPDEAVPDPPSDGGPAAPEASPEPEAAPAGSPDSSTAP